MFRVFLLIFLVFSFVYLKSGIAAESVEVANDSLLREEIGNMYLEIERLFRLAEYEEALEINKRQKELILEHFGRSDSLYGSSLNSMAVLLRRSGQNDKALPIYREAISHAIETHGKDHPIYGLRINNLAEFFRSEGQYDKALPLFYESLHKREITIG